MQYGLVGAKVGLGRVGCIAEAELMAGALDAQGQRQTASLTYLLWRLQQLGGTLTETMKSAVFQLGKPRFSLEREIVDLPLDREIEVAGV